ncbi:hypothetical protein ISN45_At01g042840 [Arabidopsis thaliana x Arabidopsis arenosa]|uniref:Uncharacterized protein n=1 Tax=Arabidopsis thaliana x Arabidopsis arenosa TaxID=1240361 RepID=A0A8T2GPF0_9BRAS|nr:hypothetical protein ISN45_At01g042840 [Arabidopsis thaliana x Arabidopsis arenosa]
MEWAVECWCRQYLTNDKWPRDNEEIIDIILY